MKTRATAVVLAAACAACGAKDPGPTVIEAALPTAAPIESDGPIVSGSAVQRPPPRRSYDSGSALDIVLAKGARAWLAIDVERIRESPIAEAVSAVMPFRRSLDRAGVEPAKDFDRIFSAVNPSLTLIDHHVDDARLQKFFERAVAESESPASLTTLDGHVCARLRNGNGRGTACAVAPGLLMVTNSTHLDLMERLAAAELPLPPNGEVAHLEVMDARIFKYVDFPNSLGPGSVAVQLQPDLGLRFDGRFESAHPSEDQKALQDRLLLPGLDVRMTQGAVNLFLDVKPDDAAALVAVLRVVGG